MNLVEFEGVYCTVAYPCWPLKAKKFSSKHFFLRKWSMVKIWLISIHWFLRYRGGSKSQTRQGAMYFLKIRFATSKFHADASPQANDSFVMVMTFERKLYRVQILNC